MSLPGGELDQEVIRALFKVQNGHSLVGRGFAWWSYELLEDLFPIQEDTTPFTESKMKIHGTGSRDLNGAPVILRAICKAARAGPENPVLDPRSPEDGMWLTIPVPD